MAEQHGVCVRLLHALTHNNWHSQITGRNLAATFRHIDADNVFYRRGMPWHNFSKPIRMTIR